MASLKRVRVIKKIQQESAWRYVSVKRNGNRYVWGDWPGIYFLEWWEGLADVAKRRVRHPRRSSPPSGANRMNSKFQPVSPQQRGGYRNKLRYRNRNRAAKKSWRLEPRSSRLDLFFKYVQAHSPDKPATTQRYGQVLRHFLRLFGNRQFIESIARADIDEYKIRRRQKKSEQHGRLITAQTVNFEVCTLRTFFYYFINERGVSMKNPCARFKHLRDAKNKASRRPPTVSVQRKPS